MARVPQLSTDSVDDPVIEAILAWVTDMESAVPNHFRVELNFPEYMRAKLGSTKVLWEDGELSMDEIQHVGITVSRANGCPYCTGAFCTILSYGLGTDEEYVKQVAADGAAAVTEPRTRALVAFAERANADPAAISDDDVDGLRRIGLTDKGVVQLVHLVSDFASYNRINQALDTDYDYRDVWRMLAFDWDAASGGPPGDNTRGLAERHSAVE